MATVSYKTNQIGSKVSPGEIDFTKIKSFLSQSKQGDVASCLLGVNPGAKISKTGTDKFEVFSRRPQIQKRIQSKEFNLSNMCVGETIYIDEEFRLYCIIRNGTILAGVQERSKELGFPGYIEFSNMPLLDFFAEYFKIISDPTVGFHDRNCFMMINGNLYRINSGMKKIILPFFFPSWMQNPAHFANRDPDTQELMILTHLPEKIFDAIKGINFTKYEITQIIKELE